MQGGSLDVRGRCAAFGAEAVGTAAGRDAWRTRVGDYRIIYEIIDGRRLVIVVVVAHRKDAYR